MIGCWFHFKKNLVKNAKKRGLYKIKYVEQTKKIIRKIGIWPLKFHDGKMKMINDDIELFTKNPVYIEFINYVKKEWIPFFQNGMLDYYQINKKMRTNNSIENYNKCLKNRHGRVHKRNWSDFLRVLLDEDDYFYNKIKIDILNESKPINDHSNFNNNNNIKNEDSIIKVKKWFNNDNYSCRIDSFFTIYLNLFYEDLKNIDNEKKYEYIKLFNFYVEQLNENNLNEIRNQLWYELNNLGVDNNNGTNAYHEIGYIPKLFNIFKNIENYCITTTIEYHCFECNNIINEEIFLNPLVSVSEQELNMYNVSNIISFKFNNSICSCKKCNISKKEREENLNCSKTFKNLSLPLFLMFIIDISFNKLKENKLKINNLFTNSIEIRIPNSDRSEKFELIGAIYMPYELHYSCWYSLEEINEGNIIQNKFLHDGIENNGYIINISRDFDIIRNNLNTVLVGL